MDKVLLSNNKWLTLSVVLAVEWILIRRTESILAFTPQCEVIKYYTAEDHVAYLMKMGYLSPA